MNTPINDGGPAFPVPMFTREADGQPMTAGEFFEGGNGMSLRDWLAAQATEADVKKHSCEDTQEGRRLFSEYKGFWWTREWAKYAYADAMLAARYQKKE